MDSEAAATTQNRTPSPWSTIAPPPLLSPEAGDPCSACFTSSSSSEGECFLSGEDEPDFETASERPLATEPDEEAVPEDDFGVPAEPEDWLPSGLSRDDVLPEEQAVAMPEAGLLGDDGGVADADEEAPPAQLVAVEPLPPPNPGLVGGGDGVLEEDGHDDDDKESVAVVTRVSEDVGRGLGAEGPDGARGGNADMKVNPDGFLSEVNSENFLPESPVGDEVVKDADASAELSHSMGSGAAAAAAAGVEKDVLQDNGEDEHVSLGGGNVEGAFPVAETVVGDLDAAKPQSSFGVISEAEEKPASDEEPEKGTAVQVAVDLKPEEESKVAIEESGAQCVAGSDDDHEIITNVSTVEGQGLQPSEAKENIEYTKEEEERSVDSSEMKERFRDVKKEELPEVTDVSLDSGEAEYSVQQLNHLHTTEIVPSEPKGVSAEPQVNSNPGECMSDANVADASSVRDVELPSLLAADSKNEQTGPDNELPMVSKVNDIAAPDPDIKHSDDGSEAAAGEDHIGLIEGGGEGEEEEEEACFDGPAKAAILGSSETAKQIITELDGGSSCASSGLGSSRGYANQADGQIVSDSDEDVDTDEEGEGKELFDSAALAALLKAATGASADGTITISAADATRTFSIDRPAGLGSSVSSLKPAPARTIRPNLFSPSDLQMAGEPENNMDEEEKKLQEKVEQIRVKFLRLVHRLGHSPEDRVAAQVLYRLTLAEGIRRGRQIGRAFSLENAKRKALQLEEDGNEPLNFSCNILVLGKTGVGKSATINSLFGEEKVHTNAFAPATSSVKEIVGVVDGIKIHVSDTPGLRPSVMDQTVNKRILTSIKKYTKKCPPDIVLYVDRLDTQTWDFNDLPLLRSITSILGSSIWFNAIVALTHASSAPPDGPSGSPISYEVFVDQRSRIVQHAIRQAAGDMRLMNPVALVENHPSCRKNRGGERVLPNGLNWRTQMLLLCYSSKILSEANSLLKLQEPSPGKLFGFRVRSPPLPFLLSSLLQSRAHPKLAADHGGDNGDSDIDLGDLSDSDQEEEEDEYDQLPPFKPLRKAQVAKLTKEQRNAYFDEYDYRVKLLQKKQLKEELRRSKEMKNRRKAGWDESSFGDVADDYDQDGAPATIPVPLPDMVLPPSFDCDSPAYRYRFLEPTSQLLVRPVLDSQGWDHDCGYDGVSLEENLPLVGKFPAGVSVQITKDKKEFNIHLDSSIAAKHGESGSTLAGFDIQTVGKQLAYILRSETKFKNLKKNKIATGISVTFLGENIATGLKVEDQLLIGKRLGLVASGGAVRAQGDVAYGANLDMRLRDKDFPIGQDLSTLGLSLMRWRRDLALGANLQSQFSIGRSSKMAVRVGLNNKLSGQITVRTSTSEQLQIALMGILPIAISIYRSIWSGESD
uniref:Translocase of chloroplast 159, chloroplastic n=1 Tax=Anthurium amnicola TaxID=1678845 RepID=A0A1D1XYP3_9ARAE